MTNETIAPESPTTPNEGTEETAFAATVSLHYIIMAIYVLGTVGAAGILLQAFAEGKSESITLYAILMMLPVTLFLLHLMALKGLKKRQPWGYKATKGRGILLLLGFPFGTVLGVFLLSQLSKFRFND